MPSVQINEVFVNQDAAGFDASNAIGLSDDVVSVVILNAFNSTQWLQIGWNQNASESNVLPPGSSRVYEVSGYDLRDNKLYIGFRNEGGTGGGKALVTIFNKSCD